MFFGLAILAVIAPALPKNIDPFFWEGHLAAGQSIEISNVYGSIRAEPATGDRAYVSTIQPGARIEVVQNQRGIQFRVVRPGKSGSDLRSDFTVHVPKGVAFVGRTVNGSVEAAALKGDAAGYTVNGDVRISTTGESRAKTVNGSIQAKVGHVHSNSLEFSAVNGGVTLEVPCREHAHVHASTGHGNIQSDFPLALERRGASTEGRSRMGHGGPELRLITINGSIRVRRI